ncbi:hypothetical protein Pmani_023114 [Petrolisthes manimaculis]|uniref:Protein deadpan n=1 Tax=Petrolisthes manimaculis TaxID=1843537 RepID=A0AAE1U1F7_9EUCA|nr:hypothetical protein Pmani_023114 [Petrolisthes manimaculis]
MLSVMRMIQEGHLEEDEDEKEDDDDEEEEGGQALGGGTHSLSKAELRKSNKPIMEKRRRARINTCLNELKSLILDAMRKDPSRHSKLEKADILEMTVKHLQAVQRQQLALAVAHDPTVLTKFRTGFTECAQEVTRYVSRIEGVEGGVRQRLLQHLGQCVTGLSTMSPVSFTAMAGLPLPVPPPPPPAPPAPPHMSSGDVNNNQARLLVAARLAAAGDAAGAALLLHGGLSLLSQGNPPPPQPRPSAPHSPPPLSKPPPPPPPPSDISLKVGTSLPGERPSRPSAFTAVRRSSSPSRFPLESCPRPPDTRPAPAPGPVPVPVPAPGRQVVAPAPRRLLGPETLVRAQVALRPLTLTRPRSPPRHPPAQTHTTHSTRTTPSNLSTGMHPHAVPTTTSHNPSFSDAAIPQSSLPHTLTTHQSTTPHTSLASNPTHLPRNPTTPTTSLTTHHLHSPSTTTTSSIASHPTHHLPHTSHKRPLENSQITRPNKVMKGLVPYCEDPTNGGD